MVGNFASKGKEYAHAYSFPVLYLNLDNRAILLLIVLEDMDAVAVLYVDANAEDVGFVAVAEHLQQLVERKRQAMEGMRAIHMVGAQLLTHGITCGHGATKTCRQIVIVFLLLVEHLAL